MFNSFFPVSISKENRLEYFNVLEDYAMNNNLKDFADMTAILEEEQLNKYISMIKNSFTN